MSRVVLSIDQGTTGSAAMVIDPDLRVLAHQKVEYPQIYPKPGWVEHNPEEIWRSVADVVGRALNQAKVQKEDIAAIGITNQRETTILWDRKSGRPIHNAIVWQCRRTTDICAQLRKEGYEKLFHSRTGLVLDPYFSGTKVKWILDHVKGARARAADGKIRFGTVDSFLVNRLTGGEAHVTDASNASRTLLFNIEKGAWDPKLLDILDIPAAILPEARGCSEIYGYTRGLSFLPDDIPIAGMAGDQQAALFGQACFAPGAAKCTYGTGAFLLMNIGDKPVASKSGLLTTVAWKLGNKMTYALEGSVFIAGAAVQWLRDGLGFISQSADIERLAASVPDSGGVVFVPALAGLGAPHWRPEARGIIRGLTRGSTPAHIARATLESIALQCHELLAAMEKDSGRKLKGLKVDGGASANNLLMQMQADIVGAAIRRPKVLETTSFGAAFLAGLAVGIWRGPKDIENVWAEDRQFKPNMKSAQRKELLSRWEIAVKMA